MPIELQGVTHIYNSGTTLQATAIEDVNLTIDDGDFIGLIGPTGSGKSTLVQHLNGLLKPTRGRVLVDGVDIAARGADLRAIRQKVGIIFQYPEHQLFDETVAADVAFGPRNLGLPQDEIDRRVTAALAAVGIDEATAKRSPFALSGGQMRRVAIAGVLAMQPKVLVLDEPAAGLDPRGREEILGRIKRLHEERGLTVVLVSHNMEDVARLAKRVVVMHRGRVVMDGSPRLVFSRAEQLAEIGLGVPPMTELSRRLRARGIDVPTDLLTVDEAREAIIRALGGRAQ